MQHKTRIAVVGGGMGGLAAAFALTDTPERRARYEVTVYERGWLLGGKGASVRNLEANARIEEHGLHLWLGFYENAFSLVRRCYAELGRAPHEPLSRWEDAFTRQSFVVYPERAAKGLRYWRLDFPENDGVPGDGATVPSGAAYVGMMLRWLANVFVEWNEGGSPAYEGRRARLREMAGDLRWMVKSSEILASTVATSMGIASRHAAQQLTRALPEKLRAFAVRVWRVVEGQIAASEDLRRLWFYTDLCLTLVIGMIRERLLGECPDYASIDHMDFRAWLKKHGASDLTVWSPPVQAVYDLAFATNEGGGAGLALNGLLRMTLTYKGAVFYKMRAGMGETIFAPLYRVLRRRGVEFRFFHRLSRVEVGSPNALEALRFERLATTTEGQTYEPLIDVDGLPCWPAAPLFDQLATVSDGLVAGGDAPPGSVAQAAPAVDRVVLRRGRDFDQAILAVPVGALHGPCEALALASPRWRAMLDKVRTIRTLGLQTWMTAELPELGWQMPSPVLGTYVPPFETWVDMSHLLERERFRPEDRVASLSYFCGSIGTSADPSPATPELAAQELAGVRQVAAQWLESHLPALLPGTADREGRLRWSLFHDPQGRQGAERLRAQYIRLNDDPSDRYVLSVPDTTQHRLRADESGFAGLLLAGDWVRTGLDVGCVESATMSGLQAARAILGEPLAIVGEGPRPVVAEPVGPRYVERPGDIVPPPPFAMSGARLHAFVLDAQRTSLQRLIDRDLNGPSGLRYRAAGSFVVLACAVHAAARSTSWERGQMSEIDVAFWVPVLGVRPTRLMWMLPHVYVDSAPAMAAGREAYGFPKQVAECAVEEDEHGLRSLGVRTHVLPTFASGSSARIEEVLRIVREGATDRGSDVRAVNAFFERTLLRRFGRGGATPSVIDALLERLVSEEVRMVFLKQFRDAGDRGLACYQAIIEASARTRAVRGGGVLGGRYRVDTASFASTPFVEELGIASSCAPRFAFWVDFDYTMEPGAEVWRA